MKKTILTIFIGVLIGTISNVVASNLLASNITYTPKDSSWGVNTVEAAIDSLKLSKTSDNYSTDEKVVGTWIDGKPLYQKTIYGHMAISNETKTLTTNFFNGASISEIPNVISTLGSSTGTYVVSDPYISSAGFARVEVYKNGDIKVASTETWSDMRIYITVQYTKTTD